jgi:hypothetical protein
MARTPSDALTLHRVELVRPATGLSEHDKTTMRIDLPGHANVSDPTFLDDIVQRLHLRGQYDVLVGKTLTHSLCNRRLIVESIMSTDPGIKESQRVTYR